MKYKVSARLNDGSKYESELPIVNLDYALHEAEGLKSKAKVITILKDQEGADHPENAGKYFLDLIVK